MSGYGKAGQGGRSGGPRGGAGRFGSGRPGGAESRDGRGLPRGGQAEPAAPRPVERPASCLDAEGLTLLGDGLSAIDPRLDDPELKAGIVRYLGEIELWNPRLGLVESAGHELITKHVLDCLAPLPDLLARLGVWDAAVPGGRLPEAARVDGLWRLADIGSGAGLPGLLLALGLRRFAGVTWRLTLVEKQQRRVGFLLNAKTLLGLDAVEVAQASLEAVGAERPGGFSLVTARAFRPLEPGIVAELARLLAPGGWLWLYKGRGERLAEELGAVAGDAAAGKAVLAVPGNWASCAGYAAAAVPVAVPGLDEERHLALLRRVSPFSGVC